MLFTYAYVAMSLHCANTNLLNFLDLSAAISALDSSGKDFFGISVIQQIALNLPGGR